MTPRRITSLSPSRSSTSRCHDPADRRCADETVTLGELGIDPGHRSDQPRRALHSWRAIRYLASERHLRAIFSPGIAAKPFRAPPTHHVTVPTCGVAAPVREHALPVRLRQRHQRQARTHRLSRVVPRHRRDREYCLARHWSRDGMSGGVGGDHGSMRNVPGPLSTQHRQGILGRVRDRLADQERAGEIDGQRLLPEFQ